MSESATATKVAATDFTPSTSNYSSLSCHRHTHVTQSDSKSRITDGSWPRMVSSDDVFSHASTQRARDWTASSRHRDSVSQVGEEQNSESEGDGETEVDSDQLETGADDEPEPEAQPKPKGGRRKKIKVAGQLNEAYRDLVNEAIEEAAASSTYRDGSALEDSKLGGSKWTSAEKKRLFSALALKGQNDLDALARAVGSKSETEIRAYILRLKQAARKEQTQINNGGRVPFTPADFRSAVEVRRECEDALDHAAGALESLVDLENARVEEEWFGETWLIDQEAADRFDKLLQASSEGPESSRDAAQGSIRASHTTVPFSAEFLDASMLLQLCRNLFMNGPKEGNNNYRTLETMTSTTAEPAIYHSALDDLHVSVTAVARKLVHATLFQATSRIRAKDMSSPEPVVTEGDVRTAADLLGMTTKWKHYWAEVPRTLGIDVYSEAEQYRKDGRTTTKNGVKLTFDEVEQALGLKNNSSVSQRSKVQASDEATQEGGLDYEVSSDEALLETEDSDLFSDGIVELTRDRQRKKSKRSLSPESFARAEDEYMEVLDRNAQINEEASLRGILRMGELVGEIVPQKLPKRPRLRRDRRGVAKDWTERIKAETRWEQDAVPSRVREKYAEESEDHEVPD